MSKDKKDPKKGDDAEKLLMEKTQELKRFLEELKAGLDEWKFTVSKVEEGMKIELHAVAIIKQSTDE